MKKAILILIMVTVTRQLSAQLTYSWAKRFGGTGNESIYKMRTDNAGNILVIGSYRATVDFDPGPGVTNRTSLGGDDIFFAKYDASGNLLWVNTIGTASDDLGYDIKADASGNIYVCGSFAYGNQSADFDPGPGVATLTSIGNIDAWFGKYDANGNYLWAHNVASQNNDHGPCLSIDASGNVYIGVMCSTVGIDFDPGPGVASLPITGPWNFVIARYTTTGNYVWCGNMNTNGTWHWMSDMENDAAGNLYVTGYFSGTTNFDIRGGSSNLVPAGGYDACLAAYTPAGNLLWAKQAGGTQDDFGQGLAINQANNAVYWTGQYKATGNFNVSGGGFNLISAGNSDGFFAKYTLASGAYVWAKSIGGTGDESPADIQLDNCENVYLTGGFDSPSADFDPGPGVSTRSTTGLTDVFYAKYSDQGCYLAASSFGGTGSDFSSSIVVNPTSLNILIANYFNGTADFDPGAGTANLTSAGGQDAFIAQYAQTLSTVPTPSNTTPPANLTVCAGQTTTLSAASNLCAGGTRLWYLTSTGGTSIASGNTYTTSPITVTTTYYVADSICGGISNRVAITVTVGAVAAITPTSNSPVCAGAAISLGVPAASTYTWTGPNTYSSNVQNPSIPNAGPVNAGTYSVVVTNSLGCVQAGTVNVAILTSTIAIQSISNNTICPGQNAVIVPSGATSYTLNPGSQTGNTFTVSPGTTTQYSITGSNASCLVNNTLTPTIYVAPLPTVAVTGNTSICQGQSASLTASGASSYTWTPSSTLNTTSGSNVSASPLTTTTYSVTGSTGTCTNSAQVTVSVIATPTIAVSSVTICAGQTTTLTASGAASYTWSTGQNGGNIAVSPASTSTFTVNGSNGGSGAGCVQSHTATVTVHNYTIAIQNVSNYTVCAGQSAVITPTGVSSYTLLPGGQTGASFTVSPGTATQYSITGSNASCPATNTLATTIYVNALPTISVSGNTVICAGQTTSLTASGGSSYTWTPASSLNTSSGGNVTANPTSTTAYTVTGMAANCTNTTQITVSVTATPTITVNSATICTGQSATLTASGATSYTWSSGQTAASQTVAPASSTTYTVQGSNSGVCMVSAQASVIVVAYPTVLSASVTQVRCYGGSDGSISISGSGADSYSWSPNSSSSNTASNLPAGVYSCTLSVSPGCATVRSYTITEPPAINGITTSSATTCGLCNGSASVAASGGTGTLHYTWQTGGGSSASANSLCAGLYTITVTDDNACSAAYTASVQSSAAFNTTVSTSASHIYQGESATLQAGKGYSYAWIANSSVTSSTSSSVSVSPMDDETFCVIVTDTIGCRDTACVDIFIKCGDVFIPTAFSPNGDGHNDDLKVYSNCLQEVLLRIFDRWGEMVFEGTTVNSSWDGTYKGNLLNGGVFVYQLTAKTKDGDSLSKKGNITLVR